MEGREHQLFEPHDGMRGVSVATLATPPDHWAALVPELAVSDLAKSLAFYTDMLGFRLCYARPGFAYLERGHAQIMLEDVAGAWTTAPANRPFGRGINLQIEAEDAGQLYDRLRAAHWPMFREMQESWYRAGDVEHGQREFLIQDPDGYLLRFVEPLGERATTHEANA